MAGKRVQLTKAELFYIQQNPDNLSEKELADELQVSLRKVVAVVDEEKERIAELEKSATNTVQPQVSPRPNSPVRQMLIRETEGGKKKRVSVMTSSASQVMDEVHKVARAKARNSQPHLAPTYPEER